MQSTLFTNLNLLDVSAGALKSAHHVLVEDGKITQVSDRPIAAPDATVMNLGGRTLMPGLIDCHAHITSAKVKWAMTSHKHMLPSFLAGASATILKGMLLRGFTTVRDAAGADAGHRQAVQRGLLIGPRLFVAGRALSQTGGHGDLRLPTDFCQPCGCERFLGGMGRIADGVDEVRIAARDEIRLGADQLKVMASGGVGSLTDPIHYQEYSVEELEALVDEASRAFTYVMAHAYTAPAIERAVRAGIRTIEHGNLIDAKAADVMAEKGAYLVPTLITYKTLAERGEQFGFPEINRQKARQVLDAGTRSLEIAKTAGVKVAFGTDLIGEFHEEQLEEFALRAEVLGPAEMIRSATTTAAEILGKQGELGVVAPGAVADLIVVEGNPLENINRLRDGGAHIKIVMKEGVVFKNTLAVEEQGR